MIWVSVLLLHFCPLFSRRWDLNVGDCVDDMMLSDMGIVHAPTPEKISFSFSFPIHTGRRVANPNPDLIWSNLGDPNENNSAHNTETGIQVYGPRVYPLWRSHQRVALRNLLCRRMAFSSLFNRSINKLISEFPLKYVPQDIYIFYMSVR